MNINPQTYEFGDVRESDQLFRELAQEGQIIATSNDKETLLKLQEDLRKAGYRKQFS
jgi:hypothetical protein